MMLLLLSFAYATPLHDCARTYDASEVLEAVQITESAFTQVLPERMLEGEKKILERLSCVSEPLDAERIARIHRILAVTTFYRDNLDGAKQALSAMSAALPGYSVDLFPSDYGLRSYLSEAGMTARETEGVPLRQDPKEQWWIEVDGLKGPVAPAHRNALLQLMNNQGKLVETRYYHPGDDLGAWNAKSKATVDLRLRGEASIEIPEDPVETPKGQPPKRPPQTEPAALSYRVRAGGAVESMVLADDSNAILFGGALMGGVRAPFGTSSSGWFLEGGYWGGVSSSAFPSFSNTRHEIALQAGYSLLLGDRFELEAGPRLVYWMGRGASVYSIQRIPTPDLTAQAQPNIATGSGLTGAGTLGLGFRLVPHLWLRLDAMYALDGSYDAGAFVQWSSL